MLGKIARGAACALILALPSGSFAQTAVFASPARPPRWTDDSAQVRLRYGMAIRNGTESDSGPGLTYSGLSPNDLALTGWLWFLFGDHLGLTAGVQREAFSLLDQGALVTSGGLLRAHVGPSVRVRLGPVRLEGAGAYAFQELPVFGTLTVPTFSSVQRHAVLLAARGLVDVGPLTVEGRFEYPIALATVGRPVTSQGLGVGGGLRVQLFRTGSLKWGLLAEAQWHLDWVRTSDVAAPLSTQQSVVRAGLALDLQWKDPKLEAEVSLAAEEPVVAPVREPEKPRVGSLSIKVLSLEGAAPVAATVELDGTPTPTSAEGVLLLEGLAPGPLSVKVTAPGFNPGEEAASIVAGAATELTVTLVPEQKRVPATLRGQVRSARGGRPVVAQLEIRELKQTIAADTTGAFSVQIAGGQYTVRITAPGFVTQTKTVTVRDGDQAIFNVDLAPK